jgi:outer membrane protein assembly factor BamB
MTKPRDPDALVSAFLAEGMEVLPDRVVNSVLDEIHRTRQRAVIGSWRTKSMSRLAIGVAAVVALLVLGGAFLIQRGQPVVGGPSPTPGVSAGPNDPASPTPSQTSSVVPARAPSWRATGSLIGLRPQPGHTATLLRDGRVLVVGARSVELYDPRTGTWAVAKSMITGREYHTATLLPDGRVLVAGGYSRAILDQRRPIAPELYDPGTGTWTSTGSMVQSRYDHTATLLPDGKVLVAGGARFPDEALDSAELYDPASGTWTITGKMVTPRRGSAMLLRDGKVLVEGRGSIELYDPRNGTWTVAERMIAGREFRTATLLLDGRVLVTGTGGLGDPAAELYDPGTGAWTATGNTVGSRRFAATATLLADGRVLVAGGIGTQVDNANASLASAELYDPSTGTWTATASMATARAYHTATLLFDGRVLVVGGSLDGTVTSAELYDPGTEAR